MRHYWLLVAALLLAVSGWLMSRGDPTRPARARADLSKFRRRTTPAEEERTRGRRTHVPRSWPKDLPEPPPRDPVMLALPHTEGRSTVVVEASAIRDTPVGRHFLDCVLFDDRPGRRHELSETLGFDPFDKVDRVAVSGDVLVVQGDFTGARWSDLCAEGSVREREGADIVCEDQRRGRPFAVVDDMLVLAQDDDRALEDALDRLDGKLPPAGPAIAEWAAYGEIYGTVSIETIASIVGRDDPRLAERIRSAAAQVELHVGLTDDVYVVADVTGDDAAETRELAKSLGAGLSLARIKARADGDERLATLLDMARVDPKDGRFSVDLAVPMDVLVTKLAPCRKDSEPQAR